MLQFCFCAALELTIVFGGDFVSLKCCDVDQIVSPVSGQLLVLDGSYDIFWLVISFCFLGVTRKNG